MKRWLSGAWLWPAAIVGTVLIQFRAVALGRVYRFEDIASYFEPLLAAVGRAIRHGRLPVWDEGAWSGYSVTGDPQVGALYPPSWLVALLPTLRAYALLVVAHALVAGFGMYALCRVRGRSRGAAAVAGVALAVGGYVVLQVRHLMFVEATAWFPWLLAGCLRYLQRRDGESLAGAALAGGLLLLTGGESMIYYGLWLALAVVLCAALASPAYGHSGVHSDRRSDGRGVELRSAAHGLLGLASAGFAALLVGGASWIPALAEGRLSPRALGADESFAGSVAWGGLHFLPSLFLPNLLGQQVRGDYVGGGTQWEIAGYYAGVLPFALALLALLKGPRQRRAERWSIAALFVVAVLLAPGTRSPLFHLFYRFLPLYGSMRCPPRALYVFALAVPMLAADGLDLIAARVDPRRARVITVAAFALVAGDLLLTHRAENPSTTLDEAARVAFPEAARYLHDHPGERYATDVHLPHPFNNSGLLWGMPSACGYSSLPLWRYLHFLYTLNHGHPYPYAQLHDDMAAQGIWRFGSPLVDALGVRWLVTDGEHPPPHGDGDGGSGWHRVFTGGDGYDVWRNDEALLPAWLVHEARVVNGEAGAAAGIVAPGFDPRRLALVEKPPRPSPVAPPSAKPTAPAATTTTTKPSAAPPVDPTSDPAIDPIDGFGRLGDGDWVFVASPKTPALLVASLPYHPGWRATVDGDPVETLAADLAFVAVALPAGPHEVHLEMTSRPLDEGLEATTLGALLVAALLLVGRRRPTSRA